MKNILVTGCSKGIGFEIVKNFAHKDNFNVLGISRDKEGLRKLEIESHKINKSFILHTLALDLTDSDSILKIVQYINSKFNKSLDGIIHNAGMLINKPFLEITKQELTDIFSVNVVSPFILTQKLIPFLKQQSHILTISSMGGIQGSQKFKGLSAYSSSKGALITLTECLAEEFKSENLIFNSLALGAVQTEMLSKAFPGYQAPLKSSEMASYIVQFFIDGAQYFNGRIIPVSLTTP
ncbi:MAG: short-chain dehydrogenase [Flavobacteriales bacterium]|nr:short-chain dehydrogenase [Flavobacteriales bacterium]|tara:strand:+ start:2628 stop:3338 length:711 start_codon:yes stop_codon:yes gene_type:complete